jgi:hypothetical protein
MGESNRSLLSDIISARENIKIKYNELKRGKYETDAFINDTLAPIINSLNRIQQQQRQRITNAEYYGPKTNNTDSEDIYQRFESSGALDKVYGVKKTRSGQLVLGNKNCQRSVFKGFSIGNYFSACVHALHVCA